MKDLFIKNAEGKVDIISREEIVKLTEALQIVVDCRAAEAVKLTIIGFRGRSVKTAVIQIIRDIITGGNYE